MATRTSRRLQHGDFWVAPDLVHNAHKLFVLRNDLCDEIRRPDCGATRTEASKSSGAFRYGIAVFEMEQRYANTGRYLSDVLHSLRFSSDA